jgi:phage terminase large subunit-like protein
VSRLDDAWALRCLIVLEDGRRWGQAATSWQRDDSRSFLDVDDPTRYHFQTRPRGAAKTDDAGGDAAVVLLSQAPPKSRSYALAADRDQGGLLIDSIDGAVARTPELAGALRVDNFRVTALRSGATLEVLPADEASAWGLRPYTATVDELAQWKSTSGPRRLWRALFSALPKVPESRLRVLTSAGDPGHWSHGVLERARARPARWRVSEVPGPCPWISAEDLEEQRSELPEWEYARLHLNQWTTSDDRLTSFEDLRACVTLDGERERREGRRYAMGVDLGLKNDRTVVTVCSVDENDPAQHVALDRIGVWQGSRAAPVDLDTVESWIETAWREYGQPSVVCDPYQAAQLMQRLARHGVHVVEHAFTQASVSRLALRLFQLISDHALQLPPDEELLDELVNVRLRESSPGVYRLDHDPDRHDDRAVSLALAAWFLLETPFVNWRLFDAPGRPAAKTITGDLWKMDF